MQKGTHQKYLLFVLFVVLVFNKVEHAALGVVLQSIKVDLKLSDTQLGLLTGIAFTLFYAVMGVPLARWADRGSRVSILSLTTALQCAAVALCGAAGSFLQLMIIRVAVAVGEAGCFPASNSLIADYFTRDARPRATALYMLGYPVSSIVGYFAAGWLSGLYGWRLMFMLLGLPGLALAVLCLVTLREPRRAAKTEERSRDFVAEREFTNRQTYSLLWKNRTFRHVVIGYSLMAFFGIGNFLWAPTYFFRSYGLSVEQLGTWFAIVWGVGGLIGTLLGGELVSRFASRNERAQLLAFAGIYVAFAFISTGTYLAPNAGIAFGFLGLTAISSYATYGPLFAMIQSLVPARTRATAIAVTYFFTNLIGMGIGPLVTGALSDSLSTAFGHNSLRYALLALCPGYLWAAWHYLLASRTIAADMATAAKNEVGSNYTEQNQNSQNQQVASLVQLGGDRST
ncbi:MAG: MFS transporter [Alphaproteobacteria bacterium]|nr:MFS transporter [Alphaproteobacteria bacterium]MDE2493063.1 MFS transporter [Alphaproteobacteria bacterium]